MKNIHLLPTDKPSRLRYFDSKLEIMSLIPKKSDIVFQHMYITSHEEIKEGVEQWYLDKYLNKPMNSGGAQYGENQDVIILTTDPYLIKDGVQAIPDEFLEWFVKNPSCEEVEVESNKCLVKRGSCACSERDIDCQCLGYKIIIPQEKPKQETLEEAAKKNYENKTAEIPIPTSYWVDSKKLQIQNFIEGAKWQAENTCKHNYILTSEKGHRVIKCLKCNNIQAI